jgi:hypothetical protein
MAGEEIGTPAKNEQLGGRWLLPFTGCRTFGMTGWPEWEEYNGRARR